MVLRLLPASSSKDASWWTCADWCNSCFLGCQSLLVGGGQSARAASLPTGEGVSEHILPSWFPWQACVALRGGSLVSVGTCHLQSPSSPMDRQASPETVADFKPKRAFSHSSLAPLLVQEKRVWPFGLLISL